MEAMILVNRLGSITYGVDVCRYFNQLGSGRCDLGLLFF